MKGSLSIALCVGLVLFVSSAAATAPTTKETGNRKMLQVGQIICDALGNCDDGRGRRWYDENHDSRRHGYGGGYDDRDHRDYGRKLQQNVGQIVCDALGNCDDGRGHRYYDPNHDQRHHDGYNNGRKLQQNVVGQVVCDALGNCDDGRGHRYYDSNHDQRHHDGYNNGRKLQQSVVGQIVCDALGNCDDGRGHRYYDYNHDQRHHGGYNDGNRGGYNDGNRGGYNDDNHGYGK